MPGVKSFRNCDGVNRATKHKVGKNLENAGSAHLDWKILATKVSV